MPDTRSPSPLPLSTSWVLPPQDSSQILQNSPESSSTMWSSAVEQLVVSLLVVSQKTPQSRSWSSRLASPMLAFSFPRYPSLSQSYSSSSSQKSRFLALILSSRGQYDWNYETVYASLLPSNRFKPLINLVPSLRLEIESCSGHEERCLADLGAYPPMHFHTKL